jgi:hypothetical protein
MVNLGSPNLIAEFFDGKVYAFPKPPTRFAGA